MSAISATSNEQQSHHDRIRCGTLLLRSTSGGSEATLERVVQLPLAPGESSGDRRLNALRVAYKHGTPAPANERASLAPVNRGRSCSRCSINSSRHQSDGTLLVPFKAARTRRALDSGREKRSVTCTVLARSRPARRSDCARCLASLKGG
jgi:hypothetical protein